MDATFEIVAVVPAAVRVTAGELVAGDRVFGTFGRQYELTRVTRRGSVVRTVREDGWTDVWPATDTLTVVRAS